MSWSRCQSSWSESFHHYDDITLNHISPHEKDFPSDGSLSCLLDKSQAFKSISPAANHNVGHHLDAWPNYKRLCDSRWIKNKDLANSMLQHLLITAPVFFLSSEEKEKPESRWVSLTEPWVEMKAWSEASKQTGFVQDCADRGGAEPLSSSAAVSAFELLYKLSGFDLRCSSETSLCDALPLSHPCWARTVNIIKAKAGSRRGKSQWTSRTHRAWRCSLHVQVVLVQHSQSEGIHLFPLCNKE